jgi:hypothetical protein
MLLPCLAVFSLALSGCKGVYTDQPLATSGDAVEEPALEGVWTNGDSDDAQLYVQKPDGYAYSLIVSEPSSKITQVFQTNLVRLNHELFADMVFQKQVVDRTEAELPLGTIPNRVIVKLDITDDDLAYSALDCNTIQNLNKEGDPPLQFLDEGDVVLLTTSTDDLRQYLSVYADHVFSSPEHYTRKVDQEAGGSSTTACSVPTPP